MLFKKSTGSYAAPARHRALRDEEKQSYFSADTRFGDRLAVGAAGENDETARIVKISRERRDRHKKKKRDIPCTSRDMAVCREGVTAMNWRFLDLRQKTKRLAKAGTENAHGGGTRRFGITAVKRVGSAGYRFGIFIVIFNVNGMYENTMRHCLRP